ncbi:Hpt domain-containing protein [Pseudoponticoccus marisrubri]|uniref:Histidine kinase n=1 Tax=Pseudoponticoccus marisrubri TaxID=1685382 RepID=A0A0W7WG63_9RHOB|nr:Hpt domain-containing protein [Pseudoponticoccus marisrubri]KUF09558.1 histidine kinase [Pseudoponticoccus marisrubri]
MIDWARVDELVEEIGAEDFSEVVTLFLAEVETAIELLEASNGNPVVIEEQMHFLKGAALNLGFRKLAQVCRTGERAASEGQVALVPVEEVRKVFASSRVRFEAELGDRYAA